jgi:hypothetical protein
MKIGNIIYYITKYTGIKYLVRRKKLNEIKIDRW